MRFDRILLAIIAVIFIVHGLANVLFWYDLYPWIDIPMHIVGGFWTGLFFFYLFMERWQVVPAKTHFVPLGFLCGGFVAGVGVVWELYEYLSAVSSGLVVFGGSLQGLHFDSLKDLFNDLIGGGLAAVAYWGFRKLKKERSVDSNMIE